MNLNEKFFWNEIGINNKKILNSETTVNSNLENMLNSKLILDNYEIERDMLYMREMYPDKVKIASDVVTEVVSEIDRVGCFIYDEYPDKYLFRRLVTTAVSQYKESVEEEIEDEKALKDMMTVLLLNEIYRRRRKKWWG